MRNQMRFNKGIFGVALLAALAACGGGSLSGGSTTGSGSGSSSGTGASATRIGSGSGSTFNDGVLDIGSSSLSAGGSTSITVTLVDGNGTLISTSSQINFNSPCISAGTATISSGGTVGTSVTANSGTAIVTYTAKGCQGSDTVTASTTVNSTTISATGTLTVATAALGSIQFTSATPAIITLQGMGGAGLQQNSTVVFAVKDSVGGAVSGATVNFKLVSSTGGVKLSQASGISDANGNVQTIVQAGTHSGPVTVQASIVVKGTTITTTSSGLAIQSGIPSQDHFSLSMSQFNVEGGDVDNNTATITVSLADRFSNPVPDGTTVSFTESNFEYGAGGRVEPSCQTAGGTCTVTWSSQDPRPTDIPGNQHVGFAYVLAFASGEESFTDNNGDGVFDDFKTCASCTLQPENFDDIGEIFAPSAEFAKVNAASTYQNGENFDDFNSDGLRNNADGKWEGVNCQETVAGDCGTSHSTGVGKAVCIVMSRSSALFTNLQTNGSSDPTLTLAGAGTASITVADANSNVLPAQTVISVDTTNLTGGTAQLTPTNSSSNYTVGNTSCADSVLDWPKVFTVTVTQTSPTTPVTGFVTLNVTTPGGNTNATTTSITITVN